MAYELLSQSRKPNNQGEAFLIRARGGSRGPLLGTREYILLQIKKHYLIQFCCSFLKSLKAFTES